MSKFKVGDKVIPVKIDDRFHLGLYEGETYLVDNVKAPCLIDIVGNFRGFSPSPAWGCNWSEEWFELADEQLIEKGNKEMTAEQIRNEILRIDVRIEEAKKDIENAQNERNSLVEKLREKGFELTHSDSENGIHEEMNFKVGDQVRVIGETHGHYFSIGEIVKVTEVNPHNYQCTGSNGQYWWLNPAEIEKI